MKCLFSSKYEMCSKSIETVAIFTKKEWNSGWNVYFLQNCLLALSILIPASFPLVETFETPLIFYPVKLCHYTLKKKCSPCPQILLLRWIFILGSTKNLHRSQSGEYRGSSIYTILCYVKKGNSKSPLEINFQFITFQTWLYSTFSCF